MLCWERALPGFVPLLLLPPVLSGQPPCGFMAVHTPYVPYVGWIDRRHRRFQEAVLAAR